MRILHLIETGGPGGAEQMLLRLATEYERRGHAQAVLLRKQGWLAAEVRSLGLDLHVLPVRRSIDFSWVRAARQLARSIGVTAIHAHEFSMNVHGSILGRALGVRTVATVHGRKYYGDRAARRAAYRCVARIARLVAVSRDIERYLVDTVGVGPDRITVIPNGIDTSSFMATVAGRETVRGQLGLQDGDILVGAVGSYYPIKGHVHLVEAFEAVHRQQPRVHLVLAGQGPLERDLRDLINQKGLEECAVVYGYTDDVTGLLSAMDVFVQPSLMEGLPLSVLEAASCGRPIVASSTGGIPEVIRHEKEGLLVPPGDPRALAEAILTLVRDASRRESLGNRARVVVQRDWSLSATADRYLALLGDQPGRGQGPAS